MYYNEYIMPTTAHLLEAKEYVQDLTSRVKLAKHSVTITSLIFTDDTSTSDLISALIQVAKRGVSVNIAQDFFTYSEFGGFFNPLRQHTARSRHATNTTLRLRKAGATVSWLGHLKFNPFAGVTHIKWSVIDDTCYVFGGVNLYTGGIDSSTDYMFRIDDSALAKAITNQQRAIIKSPSPIYQGFKGECAIGTWYVDSGKPHDSRIYDRACELAAQSTEILFVSQYSPSGPLAEQLKKTDSKNYFNQPENTSFPTSLMLRRDRHITGISSLYSRKKYLHAKFIIFTLKTGKKIALTGSHNFAYKGVAFGTREVALETTDASVINQLEAFFNQYVA